MWVYEWVNANAAKNYAKSLDLALQWYDGKFSLVMLQDAPGALLNRRNDASVPKPCLTSESSSNEDFVGHTTVLFPVGFFTTTCEFITLVLTGISFFFFFFAEV